MDWLDVQSTHLKRIKRNEKRDTLTVEFTDGSIYIYYGVNSTVYTNLASAADPQWLDSDMKSIGQLFNEQVRGKYNYRKLRGSNG